MNEKQKNKFLNKKTIRYFQKTKDEDMVFTVEYDMGEKVLEFEIDHFLRRYSTLICQVPKDSNMNMEQHLETEVPDIFLSFMGDKQ